MPNATTSTNANGNFSIHVDYPNFAVRYRIMVAAQTDSAIVYTQVPAPPPPGAPLVNVYNEGGSTSDRVESSSERTFNMDYTFGATGSRHFAITYDIQLARDFADAHRGDTDPIPRVNVLPIASTLPLLTFYEPVGRAIRWGQSDWFHDNTLIHEYAHFLQHNIGRGSFLTVPSSHNGCVARAWDSGAIINSAELAWMEGFASWFSMAVYKRMVLDPLATLDTVLPRPDGNGTTTPTSAESFNASTCTILGQSVDPVAGLPSGGIIDAFKIEDAVVAVLWDLEDNAMTNTDPSWEDSSDNADTIFKIFDGEMGTSYYPTLWDFHRAWIWRGMDPFRIEQIMVNVGADPLRLSDTVTNAALQHTQSVTSWPVYPTVGTAAFGRAPPSPTVNGVTGVIQPGPNAVFGPWVSYGQFAPASAVEAATANWTMELFFRDTFHHLRRLGVPTGAALTQVQLPDLTAGSNKIWGNPMVLKSNTDLLTLYARDLAGTAYKSAQTVYGGALGPWVSLGGTATSGFAGAVSTTNRQEIFVRGPDHHFYQCVNPPAPGLCTWLSTGGPTFSSAPTAVARGGGSDALVLCGRNDSNFVYCSEETATNKFVTWQLISTVPVTSALAAARGVGNGVSFFFRNSANSLTRVDQVRPGSPWTAADMAGSITSPPVAYTSPNTGYRSVFARGGGYDLWMREESAAGWGPWTGLGGALVGFGGASANAVTTGGASSPAVVPQ